MKKYSFSAYTLTNEFDLNSIAQHFGINKKFKWEEHLVLNSNHLDFIAKSQDKFVHIYFFGSIVFVNFSPTEMTTFIKYLENNFNSSKPTFSLKFIDEYELVVSHDEDLNITNDRTICSKEGSGYIDIISLILARSVGLEKIEESINKVIDEVEEIIDFLEKGKLNIKDEMLAKLAAKILGFKYTSISYIMLLDKPDITWMDEDIDDFYYRLSDLFEIEERYTQMKHKLETLMDITEVFSTLAHERRSTRLEWMVIILIFIEIVLYVYEIIAH